MNAQLSQAPKRINPTSGQTGRAENQKHYAANYSTPDTDNQYLSFSICRQAAHGKWESIHRALGIQLASTSHTKHTACQGCGGKDRFRVLPDYANTGKWFCGGGGDQQSGDGFSLLGHVFGWTPQEQLKAVADYLGLSTLDNKERDKIRAIAEKQAKNLLAAIAKKDEQARRDSVTEQSPLTQTH
ncbi:primase-helicase zinc-binding domain-containing protein [Thiothrix fructosivorans]|uniref:DNA primase/helicase Gp4 N-terminal Bacteriophage T7-like domain-containing protein n=1 Tax=Thiothrix fructosivorans TaxID=111770 RepID=A0A8B0SL30_9GAMM|nr:primase-helicase zinc-binding domain-containing protein [Thiothrix fructosivorans]MBO0612961.1 hypothetical protein [Thiothrix fructosivorans]QTX11589.1 hypothetical protein J1836_004345 [Thiothrix fructosivorans]